MRLLAVCCAMAAALAGCVSNPNRGLSRTVLKNRAKMQEKMPAYRILEGSLGVSGEGYIFENQRFRFEFNEELAEVDGFRTEEERYARGLTASESLNGSYDFVGEIFGVSSLNTIGVVIHERSPNPNAPAYVSYNSAGDITMHFSVKSFQDRTILAHEMAHALLAPFNIPAWMHEGIAVFVEIDHAKSKRQDLSTPVPLLLNDEGYNAVQTWRAHGEPLAPSVEKVMYRASYGIIKEMLRRFGADIFQKFFQQMEPERLSLGGMPMKQIIQQVDRVTGRSDARAFFEELKFKID